MAVDEEIKAGSWVRVWPGVRPGRNTLTTTTTGPTTMGGHTRGVYVKASTDTDGRRVTGGFYAMTHVALAIQGLTAEMEAWTEMGWTFEAPTEIPFGDPDQTRDFWTATPPERVPVPEGKEYLASRDPQELLEAVRKAEQEAQFASQQPVT